MRLGPLVCSLLRPSLHEPGMIFNPGQHATGGYFLFGLHEPGLTKIIADPVISLIRLSLVILIVLCNFLYLYLVNGFLISSQGLESEPCCETLYTNTHIERVIPAFCKKWHLIYSPAFIEIHSHNPMIILRRRFCRSGAMLNYSLALILFSFDRTVAILRNFYLFLFTKLCETVI